MPIMSTPKFPEAAKVELRKNPPVKVKVSPKQGRISISDGEHEVVVKVAEVGWKFKAKDGSTQLSFSLGSDVEVQLLSDRDPQLELPFGFDEDFNDEEVEGRLAG